MRYILDGDIHYKSLAALRVQLRFTAGSLSLLLNTYPVVEAVGSALRCMSQENDGAQKGKRLDASTTAWTAGSRGRRFQAH